MRRGGDDDNAAVSSRRRFGRRPMPWENQGPDVEDDPDSDIDFFDAVTRPARDNEVSDGADTDDVAVLRRRIAELTKQLDAERAAASARVDQLAAAVAAQREVV